MKETSINFASPLAKHFRRFVELRQTSGRTYSAGALLLRLFDRFLAQHMSAKVQVAQLVVCFVGSVGHLHPRSQENLLGVVWQALEYARRHGADIGVLPERPRVRSVQGRRPYIYKREEVDRVLLAALRLGPTGSLRPHTYATLFALLWVAGLRVGEAGRLRLRDFDPRAGVLQVHESKFRKSRIVPLSPTAIDGLGRYVARRIRAAGMPAGGEAPLFPSLRGRAICHQGIFHAFRQTLRIAGIPGKASRRWPRLHDFRHSFAVGRVIAWYRAGVDVNTKLAALSTYLGHAHVRHTQVYLQPNEPLLQEALRRFESACASRLTRTEVSHAHAN